jgi:hypothetical protein
MLLIKYVKQKKNAIEKFVFFLLRKKYGGNFIDAVLHENQPIDETIE